MIVDGKVLKFGGRIFSVNVDDVRREALELFYLLRERAGGQWAPKPWEKRPASGFTADSSASSVVASIVPVARANSLSM